MGTTLEAFTGIEKLSSSRLTTFLTCGMRYRFRYLDGIIRKPTSALTVGTTVHQAVGFNMAQKMESGEDLPESDVLDYFSTVFDVLKSDTMWYSDEDPGKFKDQGYGLVEAHHQLVAPTIMPIAVEKGFVMTLAKRKKPGDDPDKPQEKYPPIEGWVDTINKDGKIIELKTTKNKPKQVSQAHKLQTTLYTAGMLTAGVDVPGGRVNYLVKTKKKQAVSFDVAVGKAEWLYMEYVLDNVCRSVKAGLFLPNRDFYGCSRKNCAFWPECEEIAGGRVRD